MGIEEIEITRAVDPDCAWLDLEMRDFPGLDIGVGANDTVSHGGEVNCGKWTEEATVGRSAVDIGVIHGQGISYEKFLWGFRVVGIVVHQCLDQGAVGNIDEFVVIKGELMAIETHDGAFTFQLVTANIALVEQRVLDPAFSKEITAGKR